MVRTRTILVVGLVAALLVAGCATGGAGDDARPASGANDHDVQGTGAPPAEDGDAPGSTPMEDAEREDESAAQDGSSGDAQARQRRALIKTGTVVLEVDDFESTRGELVRAARDRGGYVSDSGVTRHSRGNLSWRTGYVVLRVPSGKFASLLAATRTEGTVVSEETRTRDVSDKLVDLNARLENLREQRERLRTFYEQANSTEELLRIERRLSEVQGRIERLEAKKRSLKDQVAYSTLRVEVREPSQTPTPTPTPTPEPAYHEQSLVGAFAASVHQLVVLGKSALVTAAYALPYLLIVGIPLSLLGGIVWRQYR